MNVARFSRLPLLLAAVSAAPAVIAAQPNAAPAAHPNTAPAAVAAQPNATPAAVAAQPTAGATTRGTAVDVVVTDREPPRRIVSIEWNPLALAIISKLSANVVIVPVDHHALVISPFYAHTTTAPIAIFDDAQQPTLLPKQTFAGLGAELGYRYYGGLGGPRGFFLGPSLILGAFKATAQDGTDTSYGQLGLAADVGYEALLLDNLALSLGAGVQYAAPTKSIPSQQYPANLYANALVRPRVLFSLGWAF